jgi:molybdopterin synthase catalytic subunit/molybdopterin synthase sulfur carrier subunit
VLLFAACRQMAGREIVELQLPAGATVQQLRAALAAEVPSLAPLMPHLMFALNTEYASDEALIPDGAEIACIPPVSGG